jgi:2TM domain
MSRDILDDTAAGSDANAPANGEQPTRQQAIKQIERKRRFWASTGTATIGMIILVAIWATSEYHNAGGWPTDGFSQSSGIANVWNIWIIYPFIAWVLLTAASAWFVYGRRPISESQIQREIERQAGPPR